MLQKILGPFVAVTFSAICILAGILGAITFYTVSPWWGWAIVISALFAGYIVDRLMFWGMKKMNSKKQSELARTINEHAEQLRQAIELGKKKKPTVPRTDEPLN